MVGDSNSIYSQLFHLAALARKLQQLLTKSLPCPSHSTHVANPNFGTWYRYPLFPPFPPFGGTRPPGESDAELGAARIGHERLPVGLSDWLCLPTFSTFPHLASRKPFS
jgi:hypothetical protein